MSSFPYVATSNVFNTADYNILEDGLTIEQANRLYLSLSGGTVIGNISTSNLSATSTVSAPIINSSQYLLSGSPINFSAITGVSAGTATANKALILDGAKEISTLNAITSNTYYGTTANIQFMNCDIMTATINCNSENFYAGGTLFMNSTRDASNINTITFAGTKRIQDVATIDFNLSSLIYKTIMRKSTFAGNAGIEFYDTQFSSATHAMLSFKVGNAVDNYTALKLYSPYNASDTAGTAFGQSFHMEYRDGPSFGGGLAIRTTATNAGTYSEQDRINLSVDGGAKPYIVLNPKFSQLHLFPQGLAELNTTYSENVIVGEEMRIRKYLKVDSYIQVGTSTDTSRLISALNSGMTTGTSTYFTLGRDASSKNQAEISFYYDSNNSNANRLDFGFYGGAVMYLTAQGRLGVGTSSPRAPLEISAATGSFTVVPISTITYGYNVSNNNWTNYGGGPIVVPSLSGIFNGNIFVSQNVFTTSDRRLKDSITPIANGLERVSKLKPVDYIWKADGTQDNGFIAQDLLEIPEFAHRVNPIGKAEDGSDLYGVDYMKFVAVLTAAIQELNAKVTELEAKLASK